MPSTPVALLCRILLSGATLTGCALLDQRSFDRHAGRAPVPPAPPPGAPAPRAPALFVVDADADAADWRPGLRDAVRAAIARKPNVLFTVQNTVPATASPATQAASMQALAATLGQQMAAAIVADGADPDQVQLAAAAEPGLHAPQVRVTVR